MGSTLLDLGASNQLRLICTHYLLSAKLESFPEVPDRIVCRPFVRFTHLRPLSFSAEYLLKLRISSHR